MLGYWGVVYDPKIHYLTATNLMAHIFVTLFMMLDFLITGNDIKLSHAVYTVGFGCAYAIFSFMYYSSGGLSRRLEHTIYPFLDWEKPTKALIVCLMAVVTAIIVHSLFILISFVRNFIRKLLFGTKQLKNEKDFENVNLA